MALTAKTGVTFFLRKTWHWHYEKRARSYRTVTTPKTDVISGLQSSVGHRWELLIRTKLGSQHATPQTNGRALTKLADQFWYSTIINNAQNNPAVCREMTCKIQCEKHFISKNTMHYWAGIEANTTYVYVALIHCRVVPQVETLRALKWGYVAKKLCYIQYICIYTLLICFCIGLLVITGASTFSAARYICIEVYCDDTCHEVFSIFCFVNSSEKKKCLNTHTHTHILYMV